MEVKNTFEILVDIKGETTTFVSKKFNPDRRALVMEKLMSPMAMSQQGERKLDQDIAGTVNLFRVLPDVMWEFVQDADKQKIGTKATFADGLDDDNSIQFIQWCALKLQKMQSFLDPSVKGDNG